jgi:hypothetical protein
MASACRSFCFETTNSGLDDRDRLIDQLFYAEQQRFAEDRPAPLSGQKVERVPISRVTADLRKDQAILEYVLPEKGNAFCLSYRTIM